MRAIRLAVPPDHTQSEQSVRAYSVDENQIIYTTGLSTFLHGRYRPLSPVLFFRQNHQLRSENKDSFIERVKHSSEDGRLVRRWIVSFNGCLQIRLLDRRLYIILAGFQG